MSVSNVNSLVRRLATPGDFSAVRLELALASQDLLGAPTFGVTQNGDSGHMVNVDSVRINARIRRLRNL